MITVELSPPAVPNGVIITYSVLVNETVVGMIQLFLKKKPVNIT